jgi:hypothetical protein
MHVFRKFLRIESIKHVQLMHVFECPVVSKDILLGHLGLAVRAEARTFEANVNQPSRATRDRINTVHCTFNVVTYLAITTRRIGIDCPSCAYHWIIILSHPRRGSSTRVAGITLAKHAST